MPRVVKTQSWIKLHTLDNDTAAIIRLTLSARAVFYMLQAYTMTHADTPGVISRNRAAIATADMALELHIDEGQLAIAIDELLAADGLLKRQPNGVLTFVGWNDRQSGNAWSIRDKWKLDKRRQRAPKGTEPTPIRTAR